MSEPNHEIIDLKRLSVGSYSFDFQLNDDFFASVENSEILRGQVRANAALNLREEDFSLVITVRGTVFVVCDRCLDPMPLEIQDQQSVEPDEAIDPSLPEKIDLSWLAYEITSVNIPIAHSHQPGGCNAQMDLLLLSHLCDQPDPDIDQ